MTAAPKRVLARLMLLPPIAAAVARLALRGTLPGLLRSGLDSAAAVRLNLFLAVPALRGSGRLARTAWRTIAYRAWNDLDFAQLAWRPYTVLGLERLRECLAEGRGVIACSQHVGAYRRVYYELVRHGFHVTLVADGRVAPTLKQTTRTRLVRQHADAAELARLESNLTVLDATRPGMVRAVRTALEQGSVVLFYLDGNTGAELPGVRPPRNVTTVDLLGSRVALRHGFCQIAHAEHVPIVPIVAAWHPGLRPVMTCLPAIAADPAVTAETFCRRTLAALAAVAETEIRRDLAQFEHWMYLHRWRAGAFAAPPADDRAVAAARRQIAGAAGGVRYRVDPRRILLLRMGGRRIVADAMHGTVAEAGRLAADVLAKLRRRRSYPRLCARLRRRYSGAELLEALAQLQAAGLLSEAAGR